MCTGCDGSMLQEECYELRFSVEKTYGFTFVIVAELLLIISIL